METQPRGLGAFLAVPAPLLVSLLARGLRRESARVAVFGHANAAGGRDELAKAARALDSLVRGARVPLPNWDRLLPSFPPASP